MTKRPILFTILSISAVSLFSKLLGFIREGFTAAYFGTSAESDVFFLAFSVYTLLTLVIGSSIGVSFLPVFVKTVKCEGVKPGLNLSSILLNQSYVFSLIITIIVCLFSDKIASVLAPTYDSTKLILLSSYLRIMSSSILFSIGVQLLLAVINGLKKYIFANMVEMMYSLVSIVLLVLFHNELGVDSLVYSVILAAFFQFILVVISVFLINKNGVYSFKLDIGNKKIKKIYNLSLPVFIGTGTLYVSQAIDKIIASMLVDGSVSALNYSGMIHGIINTLLISSVVTVFYTEMSKTFDGYNSKELLRTWSKGVMIIVFLVVPISIIFFMISEDIVILLLMRGAFNEESVNLTALSLSYYVIGSPFFAIRNLTTRVFYIIDNSITPMFNGIISVCLNALLSYFFALKVGVKGITLATSVSAFISMMLLLYSLNKTMRFISILKNEWMELVKVFLASFLSLLIMSMVVKNFDVNLTLVKVICVCVIFVTTYLLFLFFFNSKIIFEIMRNIKNKIK